METNKINYHKMFINIIDEVKQRKQKPTLLLHVCCGPCFTYPYELIKQYFDITIMYNNSNIYPFEEYDRRKKELIKYLADINSGIKVIEYPYENDKFNIDLLPYSEQKEGMDRCRICFRKRLSQAVEYALENKFDYCGTVMSISRYKNSQMLNEIGADLLKDSPHTKWLFADFKKEDGYQKSLKIVRDFQMYFQKYCGCKFSIKNNIDE